MIFKEVKGKLRSSSHYYVPAKIKTLKILTYCFLGGITQSGPKVGTQSMLYYILYSVYLLLTHSVNYLRIIAFRGGP